MATFIHRVGNLVSVGMNLDRLRGVIWPQRHNKAVQFVLLWLVAYAVLLGSFLRGILKHYAYLEIFPKELIMPVMMHALTAGLVVCAVFWVRWYKAYIGKLFSVLLLSFLMIGYDAKLQSISNVLAALTPEY